MLFQRSSYALLLSLLAAAPLPAADPPAPAKKHPVIPPRPTPSPTPVPAPPADAPIVLTQGVELLVTCDSKCVVEAFPRNVVRVKGLFVPMGREHTFSGTFVDPKDASKTTTEDQTFTGPVWVYRIRGQHDGQCELHLVWGLDDGEQMRLNIDSQAAPRPPPKPPDPPKPPTPTDPLTASLQAAFDLEPATVTDKSGKTFTKLEYANKLAALYAAAATVTAQDPAVKTYGDLFADMKAAGTFPDTAMPSLRAAVGKYLDDKLKPTSAKPIDRAACAAEFQAVSAALKGVK